MALHLIFLFLSLLLPVSAQQTVTLNSSLIADDNGSAWLSPSGDFGFGFQKLSGTQTFLLSIWFDKTTPKTIVWYANGDNPSPKGSRVEITRSGLVLTDPNGQTVWQSQLGWSATVSNGSMLDTGNFVLVDRNSVNLWESFNNPKDTILPSQKLNSSSVLFSRLSETNFSRGRFKLYFSGEGSMTLTPLGWPSEFIYGSYFSSDTFSNNSEPVTQLVFNESSPTVYLTSTNGESLTLPWKNQNTAPSLAASYYRATLDYTGVFTMYSHPKGATAGDQRWSIVRFLPEDICSAIFNDLGSGACGYNSYCNIDGGRPTCECPPGYLLIDRNNEFGGCKPNFPLGCGDEESANLEDLYEFLPLRNVNWPLGDYERISNYSEANCRASCLQDCFCAAAVYGTTSTCWKKRLPLTNGRFQESSESTALILMKVRRGPICRNKKNNNSILVGSLSASLVVNALLLITISSIFCLIQIKKSTKSNPVSTETNMHMFSYKELDEATNNFQDEIGRGSSAIVYKGILKLDSNKVVAVKKLDKLAQSAEKEFKTEMEVIGKTSHKNLVRLLGFCNDGPHPILVYEFMDCTLANFLFGIQKPSWNVRAKIVLEIARGLVYLHEECEVPIIHCDIKPENVLLDESYTAKISDFGLAKLLNLNQSQTLTGIRGTRGYVAPEWFRNSAITAKVDVYSFGVMLLEIIYCRKNVPKVVDDEGGILIDWVYDCFVEGKIGVLAEMDDKERIEKWVVIGIWCTQEDPSKRPSMKMVLQMLEGFVDVSSPPMPRFSSNL